MMACLLVKGFGIGPKIRQAAFEIRQAAISTDECRKDFYPDKPVEHRLFHNLPRACSDRPGLGITKILRTAYLSISVPSSDNPISTLRRLICLTLPCEVLIKSHLLFDPVPFSHARIVYFEWL